MTTPFPPHWKKVILTGTFANLDGTAAQGSIVITSRQVVTAEGVIVVPIQQSANLVNGSFSILLASTNDPELNVQGWTYRIFEKIPNGRQGYDVFIDYHLDVVDLATLAPVAIPPVIAPLGSASLKDISYFATATQGQKADTSLIVAEQANATASSALSVANSASTAAAVADGKAVTAQTAAAAADVKATNAGTAASVADGKATSAALAASVADGKAVAAQTTATNAGTAAAVADTKATNAATAASVADGKAVGAASAASVADGKAVAAQTSAAAADTKATNAAAAAATADTKATNAGTAAAAADVKATSAGTAAAAAQSTATAAGTAAAAADTKATNAGTAAATADGKAVAAQTTATNAGNAASVADGKAVAAQTTATNAGTAAATADTKATNAGTAAATADGKAVAAQTTATGAVNSITALGNPTGSASIGFQQDGTGATARSVQSKARESKSIFDFLANADTGIAASIGRAKAAGVSNLRIPAGSYVLEAAVDIGNMNLFGDGVGKTFLDVTALTDTNAIIGSGSMTQIAGLSAAVAEGDSTVTLADVTGLGLNDILVIYNPAPSSWLSSRTYYHAGEYIEIAQIDGNVLTLKAPLYDSYNIADVNVYKLNRIDMTLSDMSIKGAGSINIVRAEMARLYANNLAIDHSNSSCLSLSRCYGSKLTGITTNNKGGSTGTEYGIILGNCQDVIADDCYLYSQRHAFTTGGSEIVGAVPNRNIRIRNSTLKNNRALTIEAANFHGNVEDSSYDGCTIYGGLALSGRRTGGSGNTIFARKDGVCVILQEMKGGIIMLENNRMLSYVNPATNSRGVIDIGGNSNGAFDVNCVLPLTLEVKGGSLYGRNFGSNTNFISIVDRGSGQPLALRVDGLLLDVNALDSVMRTNKGTGVTAVGKWFIVDNIVGIPSGSKFATHVAAEYLAALQRMPRQSGTQSMTTTATPGITGTAITFTNPYPRAPVGQVSFVGVPGGIGGKTACPQMSTLNATTLTPYARSGDQTNFTAGVVITMQWTAEMREV